LSLDVRGAGFSGTFDDDRHADELLALFAGDDTRKVAGSLFFLGRERDLVVRDGIGDGRSAEEFVERRADGCVLHLDIHFAVEVRQRRVVEKAVFACALYLLDHRAYGRLAGRHGDLGERT